MNPHFQKSGLGTRGASGFCATGAPLLFAAILLFLPALLAASGGSTDGARLRVHRVDPESAPWYAFACLDGAGPSTSRRIVAYRERVGPLVGPLDLRRVPGVGMSRLHRWHPWLRDPEAPR